MKIFNLGQDAKRPRILFLDFDGLDLQPLRQCGYKIYSGQTGLKDRSIDIPIEKHRVDILVYRASYSFPPKPANADEHVPLGSFRGYSTRGHCYFGEPSPAQTSYCGKQSLFDLGNNVFKKGGTVIVFLGELRIRGDDDLSKSLLGIDGNSLAVYRDGGEEKEYELGFHCDEKVKGIGSYIQSIMTGKLGYSFNFLRGINGSFFGLEREGYNRFLAHDEEGYIYAYFESSNRQGHLLLLPDLGAKNVEVTKEILRLIPDFSSKDIFSKTYAQEMWVEIEQYKFVDELSIIVEKRRIAAETEKKLSDLEDERLEARLKTDFFRDILINGDDDKVEDSEKLKPCLKKVLEWLGITVIDLDEKLKKQDTALMNDFILKISNNEILCEAKGVATGPRGEYVNQVCKHIIRYSHLTKKSALPGILILNYERDKPPHIRSNFYTDAAILKEAEESCIGLLDTRVLFDICKKIYGHKDEDKLKEKARQLISGTGVIKAENL